MIKFITILIGCSLTLAVSVRAEQEDPKKKPVQKSKPVLKQQFTPKHTMTNTHLPEIHNTVRSQPTVRSKDTTLPSNAKIHDSNVSKEKLHTLPAVQSNKFQANKQTVKNFQSKHLNFHAKVNSSIVSAKFNQNFHIKGAQNWKGSHYSVFKSYHPQWHDHGWWHSHHNHILLIGGGWYYWNAGYWYPAWGYDESAAYYPYDGPIYVGNNPTPLDQVVADVQTTLQEQGYYHGEVDGLVGPLTQEALAAYQSAQGLEQTAAIDQPTLEALGLG
ncbi:MAG TPA: peptidoglycan-binding domain-containing protein [Chthoniobacterales bacterium]